MAEQHRDGRNHSVDEELAEVFRPEIEAAEALDNDPDASTASADGPGEKKRSATTDKDFFHAAGGWGALFDVAVPWLSFLAVYQLSGHNLQLALIVAIGLAAAVGVLRFFRKQPLRNIVGGFIGVLISAYIANKSGRAEDVYVPGLLTNLGYGLVYLITVLIRWPIFGVLYGMITQTGTAWRKDPAMLRGFTRATLVFVGLFGLRLAVQVPLYFAGALNALGIAKVALGPPVYALALWLSYTVLRASLPPEKWDEIRDTAIHLLRGNKK
ncbi:DUF3159 domain-containing protein [Kribbella deserti]|uniref:DUF3159 domain-containing protein n=1 Tax=Kribbella deserti TaxID=1926257 RepID=A0ABV6QL74_9ACTN